MNQYLHKAKCYSDGKLLGTVDVAMPSFHLEFDASSLNALFGSLAPKPLLCAIAYQFSKS